MEAVGGGGVMEPVRIGSGEEVNIGCAINVGCVFDNPNRSIALC